MIPTDYYMELSTFWICTTEMLAFIMFFCDSGGQIVYTTFYLSFHFFITRTVGYMYDAEFVSNIIKIFGAFFLMCMVSILFTYIMELQSRLFNSNFENLKLLDGMHEGLLILSKSENEGDRRVMFINNPVQKIVSSFL